MTTSSRCSSLPRSPHAGAWPETQRRTSPPADPLADLVPLAVAGDRDAVDRLLAVIRPLVVNYSRSRLGRSRRSYATADDVAQDVCLAVFSALPRYRGQGVPFLAFVYGIAAHKVSDAMRAARTMAEPIAEIRDAADETATPEHLALQRERVAELRKLVDRLPAHQREVLLLRAIGGLTSQQTADAVGSTPGAVRVAQHRAVAKLRQLLAAELVSVA